MEPIFLALMGLLVVFMFYTTRKRQKLMREQQEEKATKLVPGAKVLLQGGIYGTVAAYDHDDLDSPALIEIAPGTVIEVHSQAILRIVEPTVPEENDLEDYAAVDRAGDDEHSFETPEQTRARLERDAEDK